MSKGGCSYYSTKTDWLLELFHQVLEGDETVADPTWVLTGMVCVNFYVVDNVGYTWVQSIIAKKQQP